MEETDEVYEENFEVLKVLNHTKIWLEDELAMKGQTEQRRSPLPHL